jgi:hypothetical protein
LFCHLHSLVPCWNFSSLLSRYCSSGIFHVELTYAYLNASSWAEDFLRTFLPNQCMKIHLHSVFFSRDTILQSDSKVMQPDVKLLAVCDKVMGMWLCVQYLAPLVIPDVSQSLMALWGNQLHANSVFCITAVSRFSRRSVCSYLNIIWHPDQGEMPQFSRPTWDMRVYPKVSGLATWSENCKWYSSLPLGAVVSLFCESV